MDSLLLIHGVLATHSVWGPLERELSGEVRTVAPDLPGCGHAVSVDGSFTLDDVVDSLAPVVEAERPRWVLGHSMGGIIALALARRFPRQFERIAVAGLPVYRSREEALDYLNRRGFIVGTFLAADHRSHELACRPLRTTSGLWSFALPLWFPRHPRRVIRDVFEHSRAGHVDALEQVVYAGRVEELADAPAPVAALHGRRDRAAPLSPVEHLAREHGWDLAISPTGNHQIVVERPRLVARWLRDRVLMPAVRTDSITSDSRE